MPHNQLQKAVPVPPFPVDGAGFMSFNNYILLSFVGGVPLLVTLALPVPLYTYPIFLLLLCFPAFAVFNILWNINVKLPAQTLPGKPLETYLTILDPVLKQQYNGYNKIPMNLFCEAYFDGKIDVKGDFFVALEARHDWASFQFTWSQITFFVTQWVPELLLHSKQQDEDQVREHYDRGNDFYEAFLGPMMIYTSGIISDLSREETLEELQQNKLNIVLDKIQIQKGDKMLDIGCGWGTLSVEAAKRGADVTGVTLSRNQTSWGLGKAAAANVTDNVRLLCMDYRDIPFQKYNKITCLEMAEHVGVRKFHDFMIQVREMLTDDGIFYLQIAGLRRAWQYEDFTWGLFMAKYVFPGADASMPLNWVLEQAERAGFEIQSMDTIGVHYSATIHRWYQNWVRNRADMHEKYGKRWVRIWELFLGYSTIAARQGTATCYQIVMHKNSNAIDRTRYITKRLVA